MQQRRSFVTETVFSHPSKLALIERARRLGFVVVLYHIHVSRPELAAARVRTRVSAGGHDVPPEKLAARHARTLGLLPRAVLLADRAYGFDNSRLDRSFTHVLTVVFTHSGRSRPRSGAAAGLRRGKHPSRLEAIYCQPTRHPATETERVTTRSFTAILEREGDGYVALCPELDVASQGRTVEEATANLKEAVDLFLETADPSEIADRLRGEIYVTRFETAHG